MDTKVILEVNNEIDYFIVKATREWGLHHRKDVIMVNAQKIYEALEKQIPKKHKMVDNVLYCSACESYHGRYGDIRIPVGSKYCPYCGQALDWSEEDE